MNPKSDWSARVFPVPKRVRLDQVLAYPVNALTAYYAVKGSTKAQPGRRVLLDAASSCSVASCSVYRYPFDQSRT